MVFTNKKIKEKVSEKINSQPAATERSAIHRQLYKKNSRNEQTKKAATRRSTRSRNNSVNSDKIEKSRKLDDDFDKVHIEKE